MSATTVYPIDANAALVDPDQINAYMAALFQHVDWSEGGVVSLLGIGEKGTPREGDFRERKFIAADDFGLAAMHARRWGAHHIATFIVPAVLHPAAQIAGDVTLDKIKAFTALVVDLDSGDTTAKLAHLERYLGRPTMVIRSGGRTAEGVEKLHAYWRLSEPSEEIDRIAVARKVMAARAGGDQAFGRGTQVVRLAGTVHAKNGHASRVEIVYADGPEYELAELLEAIEAMPAMDGVAGSEVILPGKLLFDQGNHPAGGMDFSAGAGRSMSPVVHALTHEIHEGGDELNRWGEFSKVAGLEIANARKGLQTLDRAFELVDAWVAAKMIPPKPAEWVRAEFLGVLRADIANHGPIEPAELARPAAVEGRAVERVRSTDDLLSWSVAKRSVGTPAPEKVLVDGLIYAGKKHMLVAEGGAGKTFLCMDLALSLACAAPDEPQQTWTGSAVMPAAHGGTVILMTAEDDVHELHRRWHGIDPSFARRAAAGDRLIALPMDNLGGAFPLVAYHPGTRAAVPSDPWLSLYQAIVGIVERGGTISAIIIDTLNSTLHGDENSATVMSEYLRAIAPLIGDLGAAVIVTHHVRKAGNEPVDSPESMLQAVRGSGALANGMRMVLGIWAVPDYARRMRSMKLQPKRGALFAFATLKWNSASPNLEVRTMLRGDNGLLSDVTAAERVARGSGFEQEAWLVYCVGWYADRGVFFTKTNTGGLFAQRAKLAPVLRDMARADLEHMCDRLVERGRLITRIVNNAGKSMTRLDVPEKSKHERNVNTTDMPQINFDDCYFDHGWQKVEEN